MSAEDQNLRLPEGLNHALGFAVFNALSFQIVLGSPMILFAKSLGATATVLGIIAGMMPLLVIFQIPAAQYVANVGYKRFVLAGWSLRVIFIACMIGVPMGGSVLSPPTQLVILLTLLFFFNLSRGISSCAWLPWITSLIPPTMRGRYLAREAASVNLASFVVMMLSAIWLGADPTPVRFACLLGFSALMGWVSLEFIKRIPEGEDLEQVRTSNQPVPWAEIAGYQPFRKLMWVAVMWAVAYGGVPVFTVAYLKGEGGGLADGTILLVTAASFLGGLSSVWILGPALDRLGSKPVLMICLWLCVGAATGWWLVAAGLMDLRLPLVCAFQAAFGLFAALVNMANTRLVMAIVPPMGRSHFFALYSVVSNVTLGIAPIVWGLIIDSLGPLKVPMAEAEWNRYSVFFAGTAVVFITGIFLCRRLHEPQAGTVEQLLREMLFEPPQRMWIRFWTRP